MYIFPLKKGSNVHPIHNIQWLQICFYTTPVWNKSIPSSITKKKRNHDNLCSEQIGEQIAKYFTVLPICVSIMITSQIHKIPISDRICSNF